MAASDSFGEGELVLLGLVGLGIWIFSRGGFASAAADAGAAAVDAVVNTASGVTTGVVTGISKQVGLPTPAQTTDDPYIARWIMDQPSGGKLAASKWATSSAFLNALTIDAGTGVTPPVGSPLWLMFGGPVIDSSGIPFDAGNPTGSADGW
jgi:hypothetical protein